MYYREVEYTNRKPEMSANIYFFKAHSGGYTYGFYNGHIGNMEKHLQDYPNHKLIWLEPECEYDSYTYYKRICQ